MSLAFLVRGSAATLVTDGIGTPDPNPRNLPNWCFQRHVGESCICLKLVIRDSSWGLGFRCSLVT